MSGPATISSVKDVKPVGIQSACIALTILCPVVCRVETHDELVGLHHLFNDVGGWYTRLEGLELPIFCVNILRPAVFVHIVVITDDSAW